MCERTFVDALREATEQGRLKWIHVQPTGFIDEESYRATGIGGEFEFTRIPNGYKLSATKNFDVHRYLFSHDDAELNIAENLFTSIIDSDETVRPFDDCFDMIPGYVYDSVDDDNTEDEDEDEDDRVWNRHG